MPPKKKVKKGQGTSRRVAPVGDRLSALPDDLLHHVLSYLPAEDAVRTCVLARRWCDLWKSTTTLQIRRDLKEYEPAAVKAARKFVDQLLRLRKPGAHIDTCTLSFFSDYIDLGDGVEISRIKLWIRRILKCKARVFTIEMNRTRLDGLKLISSHLEILHLSNIVLEDGLVNFSSCPALKELRIYCCDLRFDGSISSQSLKFLRISDCVHDPDSRICIDTPNLNSLHLVVEDGRTPLLLRMPSLVEAFVNIEYDFYDSCSNSAGSGDCADADCRYCYGVEDDSENCLLLQSLSEAQNLVLRSYVEMFVFRRDLKWHPIFGNLRTLLLNEYWCVPDDFSPLAYMLEHSPVLEKLTLVLYSRGPKHKFGIKGRCNSTELSTLISHKLKIVHVKCENFYERVLKVLRFLGTLGINFNLDEVDSLE